MAKQRWLVRDNWPLAHNAGFPSNYFVLVGAKPRMIKRGQQARAYGPYWSERNRVRILVAKDVEALLPPRFHLDSGGGPVLLGEW